MTAHRSLMLAVFLTVAPFVGGPVAADPVVDFTGGSTFAFNVDETVGWKFTVDPGSTITIGGLGLFDVGKDGFTESHAIALWNSDGTSLLAKTTIDTANSTPVASTSDVIVGNWRSTSMMNAAGTAITSLQLNPGTYVVGAFYVANSKDAFITLATTSTIPGVTFKGARNEPGNSLVFPSTDASEAPGGFFGPNLFTAAAPPVPEPETYAMLMAGLGLLGLIARRRRKSLNAAA